MCLCLTAGASLTVAGQPISSLGGQQFLAFAKAPTSFLLPLYEMVSHRKWAKPSASFVFGPCPWSYSTQSRQCTVVICCNARHTSSFLAKLPACLADCGRLSPCHKTCLANCIECCTCHAVSGACPQGRHQMLKQHLACCVDFFSTHDLSDGAGWPWEGVRLSSPKHSPSSLSWLLHNNTCCQQAVTWVFRFGVGLVVHDRHAVRDMARQVWCPALGQMLLPWGFDAFTSTAVAYPARDRTPHVQ